MSKEHQNEPSRALLAIAALGAATPALAQQHLPFAPVPSASTAGPTMQQSRH